MKVRDIKTNLNEAVKAKIKMNEDSHFEGHNFITYGKEIAMVNIDLPLITIDKNSVIVKWVGKLELHNDGVYGFDIDVKSFSANSEKDKDEQTPAGPLNFNGFEFEIKKVKNPEAADVQVFIDSVYIATQEKRIYVEFKI
jgi:hypothetical protein